MDLQIQYSNSSNLDLDRILRAQNAMLLVPEEEDTESVKPASTGQGEDVLEPQPITVSDDNVVSKVPVEQDLPSFAKLAALGAPADAIPALDAVDDSLNSEPIEDVKPVEPGPLPDYLLNEETRAAKEPITRAAKEPITPGPVVPGRMPPPAVTGQGEDVYEPAPITVSDDNVVSKVPVEQRLQRPPFAKLAKQGALADVKPVEPGPLPDYLLNEETRAAKEPITPGPVVPGRMPPPAVTGQTEPEPEQSARPPLAESRILREVETYIREAGTARRMAANFVVDQAAMGTLAALVTMNRQTTGRFFEAVKSAHGVMTADTDQKALLSGLKPGPGSNNLIDPALAALPGAIWDWVKSGYDFMLLPDVTQEQIALAPEKTALKMRQKELKSALEAKENEDRQLARIKYATEDAIHGSPGPISKAYTEQGIWDSINSDDPQEQVYGQAMITTLAEQNTIQRMAEESKYSLTTLATLATSREAEIYAEEKASITRAIAERKELGPAYGWTKFGLNSVANKTLQLYDGTVEYIFGSGPGKGLPGQEAPTWARAAGGAVFNIAAGKGITTMLGKWGLTASLASPWTNYSSAAAAGWGAADGASQVYFDRLTEGSTAGRLAYMALGMVGFGLAENVTEGVAEQTVLAIRRTSVGNALHVGKVVDNLMTYTAAQIAHLGDPSWKATRGLREGALNYLARDGDLSTGQLEWVARQQADLYGRSGDRPAGSDITVGGDDFIMRDEGFNPRITFEAKLRGENDVNWQRDVDSFTNALRDKPEVLAELLGSFGGTNVVPGSRGAVGSKTGQSREVLSAIVDGVRSEKGALAKTLDLEDRTPLEKFLRDTPIPAYDVPPRPAAKSTTGDLTVDQRKRYLEALSKSKYNKYLEDVSGLMADRIYGDAATAYFDDYAALQFGFGKKNVAHTQLVSNEQAAMRSDFELALARKVDPGVAPGKQVSAEAEGWARAYDPEELGDPVAYFDSTIGPVAQTRVLSRVQGPRGAIDIPSLKVSKDVTWSLEGLKMPLNKYRFTSNNLGMPLGDIGPRSFNAGAISSTSDVAQQVSMMLSKAGINNFDNGGLAEPEQVMLLAKLFNYSVDDAASVRVLQVYDPAAGARNQLDLATPEDKQALGALEPSGGFNLGMYRTGDTATPESVAADIESNKAWSDVLTARREEATGAIDPGLAERDEFRGLNVNNITSLMADTEALLARANIDIGRTRDLSEADWLQWEETARQGAVKQPHFAERQLALDKEATKLAEDTARVDTLRAELRATGKEIDNIVKSSEGKDPKALVMDGNRLKALIDKRAVNEKALTGLLEGYTVTGPKGDLEEAVSSLASRQASYAADAEAFDATINTAKDVATAEARALRADMEAKETTSAASYSAKADELRAKGSLTPIERAKLKLYERRAAKGRTRTKLQVEADRLKKLLADSNQRLEEATAFTRPATPEEVALEDLDVALRNAEIEGKRLEDWQPVGDSTPGTGEGIKPGTAQAGRVDKGMAAMAAAGESKGFTQMWKRRQQALSEVDGLSKSGLKAGDAEYDLAVDTEQAIYGRLRREYGSVLRAKKKKPKNYVKRAEAKLYARKVNAGIDQWVSTAPEGMKGSLGDLVATLRADAAIKFEHSKVKQADYVQGELAKLSPAKGEGAARAKLLGKLFKNDTLARRDVERALLSDVKDPGSIALVERALAKANDPELNTLWTRVKAEARPAPYSSSRTHMYEALTSEDMKEALSDVDYGLLPENSRWYGSASNAVSQSAAGMDTALTREQATSIAAYGAMQKDVVSTISKQLGVPTEDMGEFINSEPIRKIISAYNWISTDQKTLRGTRYEKTADQVYMGFVDKLNGTNILGETQALSKAYHRKRFFEAYNKATGGPAPAPTIDYGGQSLIGADIDKDISMIADYRPHVKSMSLEDSKFSVEKEAFFKRRAEVIFSAFGEPDELMAAGGHVPIDMNPLQTMAYNDREFVSAAMSTAMDKKAILPEAANRQLSQRGLGKSFTEDTKVTQVLIERYDSATRHINSLLDRLGSHPGQRRVDVKGTQGDTFYLHDPGSPVDYMALRKAVVVRRAAVESLENGAIKPSTLRALQLYEINIKDGIEGVSSSAMNIGEVLYPDYVLARPEGLDSAGWFDNIYGARAGAKTNFDNDIAMHEALDISMDRKPQPQGLISRAKGEANKSVLQRNADLDMYADYVVTDTLGALDSYEQLQRQQLKLNSVDDALARGDVGDMSTPYNERDLAKTLSPGDLRPAQGLASSASMPDGPAKSVEGTVADRLRYTEQPPAPASQMTPGNKMDTRGESK